MLNESISKTRSVLFAVFWLILASTFLAAPSLLRAQDIYLPGKVVLSVEEEYSAHTQTADLKVRQDPHTSDYSIDPPENRSGFGYGYFSKAPLGAVGDERSKGDLEVYVIHRQGYVIPTNGNVQVLHNGRKFTEIQTTADEHCRAEQGCDFDSNKLIPAAEHTTLNSHPHLKEHASTLQSESSPVRRLTYMDVDRGDIDFINPTVLFDSHSCSMGSPSATSRCRELSAVLLRFIPYEGSKAELTVHVITPKQAAFSEEALHSASKLLHEQSNPVWLAVLDALHKYRPQMIDGQEAGYPVYEKLPMKGVPHEELVERFTDIATLEQKSWINGTCSGTMYCGEKDFYLKQIEASSLFYAYNALQADMHPSMVKMEAEIVAMTLNLQGGADLQVRRKEDNVILDEPSGYVTLGGTDSNMAAMRAMNKIAKQKGFNNPVFLAPDTVHPSVDKAADYYGFELRKVKTGSEAKKVNVSDVKRMIDEDDQVAGIVASAPGYSHGTTDPIQELSDLLMDYKEAGRELMFHVDSCMGGFIYPFARFFADKLNEFSCQELEHDMGAEFKEELCHKMHFPRPLFEYPAVTSVSADLHKYGYSIKGNSVIMFRSEDLLMAQFFSQPEWDGGAMINHGSFGSRSAGLVVAGYYTMLSLGVEGYMRRAWKILLTAHRFQNIVRSHPELKIIGDPGMCFSFVARDPEEINIFHIADIMKTMPIPWRFNHLKDPDALHFCITGPQTWLGQDTGEKTDPLTGAEIPKDDPEVTAILEKFKDVQATEDNMAELAEVLDRRLDRDLSSATVRFREDLAKAVAAAPGLKDQPPLSGSMYGLGATGVSIVNPALADAILYTGRLLMLKTPNRGLDSLLDSGKYRVEKTLKSILQIPAY